MGDDDRANRDGDEVRAGDNMLDELAPADDDNDDDDDDDDDKEDDSGAVVEFPPSEIAEVGEGEGDVIPAAADDVRRTVEAGCEEVEEVEADTVVAFDEQVKGAVQVEVDSSSGAGGTGEW